MFNSGFIDKKEEGKEDPSRMSRKSEVEHEKKKINHLDRIHKTVLDGTTRSGYGFHRRNKKNLQIQDTIERDLVWKS